MTTLWPWSDPGVHAAMLAAALAWDRWVGEPPIAVHPVVWMGTAIGWMRNRAPAGSAGAFAWGLVMALVLPAASAAVSLVVLVPGVGVLLGAWLLTSAFALRGLPAAGEAVAAALDNDDLESARRGLRSLCSRDPAGLTAAEVSAAATESVAENCSDSLVAPLFWYAIGGLPMAMAYRCVNTLDAMVGYRGRYEWLGKPSARLDDVLNVIPARLSAAALLVAGATMPQLSVRRGLRVLWADRNNTSSPNAGWPMAATAGLLGVELGKTDHYVLGQGLGECTGSALEEGCAVSERAMWLAAAVVVAAFVGAAVVHPSWI